MGKSAGLTSSEHKWMQLKAAEDALARAVKLRAKYNKSADARIRHLEKLIATLRPFVNSEQVHIAKGSKL